MSSLLVQVSCRIQFQLFSRRFLTFIAFLIVLYYYSLLLPQPFLHAPSQVPHDREKSLEPTHPRLCFLKDPRLNPSLWPFLPHRTPGHTPLGFQKIVIHCSAKKYDKQHFQKQTNKKIDVIISSKTWKYIQCDQMWRFQSTIPDLYNTPKVFPTFFRKYSRASPYSKYCFKLYII